MGAADRDQGLSCKPQNQARAPTLATSVQPRVEAAARPVRQQNETRGIRVRCLLIDRTGVPVTHVWHVCGGPGASATLFGFVHSVRMKPFSCSVLGVSLLLSSSPEILPPAASSLPMTPQGQSLFLSCCGGSLTSPARSLRTSFCLLTLALCSCAWSAASIGALSVLIPVVLPPGLTAPVALMNWPHLLLPCAFEKLLRLGWG